MKKENLSIMKLEDLNVWRERRSLAKFIEMHSDWAKLSSQCTGFPQLTWKF